MPPGEEKFVGIAELKGWGYSNSDLRGYIGALSILQVYRYSIMFVCELWSSWKLSTQGLWLLISWMQDYYPERLGKLFILHAPYIFMKVWKIVYPFIDNKTKKKVMF